MYYPFECSTHYIRNPARRAGALQDAVRELLRIPLLRTPLNKEKESEACPIVSARFLACLTQRTGGAAGTALAGEYGQGHQRARCSSQPQTDQGSVVQDQGTEPGS